MRLHEIVARRIGVSHPDVLERQGADRGEEVAEAQGIVDAGDRERIGEGIDRLVDAHAGVERHRLAVRDRIADGAVVGHGVRRAGRPGDRHPERRDARGEKQVARDALGEPGERLQVRERPRAERGELGCPVRTENAEGEEGITDREACRLCRREPLRRRQYAVRKGTARRGDGHRREVIGEGTEGLRRTARSEPLAEEVRKARREERGGACPVTGVYPGKGGIYRGDPRAVRRRHFTDVERGGRPCEPDGAGQCRDAGRKRGRGGDDRLSCGDGQRMAAGVERFAAQVNDAVAPEGRVLREGHVPREHHRRGQACAVTVKKQPRADVGDSPPEFVAVRYEKVGAGIGVLGVVGDAEAQRDPGE